MRFVNEIIIHCTATRPNVNVTVESIDKYHRQKNGWRCIGYHFVVYQDGSVHKGRDLAMVGAHCKGHNERTIGICYVGGLNENGKPCDTRTAEQKAAIANLIKELKSKCPSITKVHGHRDYNATACPCFDAHKEYQNLV